jgi:RNA polymerase sigma factor (sigma-70 family)
MVPVFHPRAVDPPTAPQRARRRAKRPQPPTEAAPSRRLLLRAPSPSEEAVVGTRMSHEHLVEQALYLPRREAARWRHTRFDQEDLVGDGNLALVKAARRYDPSYGVPFPAFAVRYVRGAILDAIRSRARRNSLGEGIYADVVSFDDLGPARDGDGRASYDPPDPRPTPDATLESLERLRVLATLPASERVALVRTTVDGESAAEVARDLGVSAGRVHTLVHTGSTRLRKRAA